MPEYQKPRRTDCHYCKNYAINHTSQNQHITYTHTHTLHNGVITLKNGLQNWHIYVLKHSGY